MITTVAVVVYTHNLAFGVLIGVILSAILFGWKMAKIKAYATEESGKKTYHITGQLFFGTMTHFVELFDLQNDPDEVTINFSASHVWDQSAVTGIAKVIFKYQQSGKNIHIVGLNDESKHLVYRIGLTAPSGH